MDTPPRQFKSHAALEALQRGSPAYKQRLYKRAFARVEQSRAAILSRARGSGSAREELQHLLEDEAEAMEVGEDALGEDTSYSDIPASVYMEYEEFLYALQEQLQRDLDAECYDEFERFEEAALEDAICRAMPVETEASDVATAMDLSD